MKRGLRIYVASLSALTLGLPATASAATPVSQSFRTPGEQQFVVPPGITSVQVELVGGYGGSGNAGIPGGIPTTDRATVTVSPGETLYAEVAGDGQSATGTTNYGGYGGGGNGAIRSFLFGSAPTGGVGAEPQTCSDAPPKPRTRNAVDIQRSPHDCSLPVAVAEAAATAWIPLPPPVVMAAAQISRAPPARTTLGQTRAVAVVRAPLQPLVAQQAHLASVYRQAATALRPGCWAKAELAPNRTVAVQAAAYSVAEEAEPANFPALATWNWPMAEAVEVEAAPPGSPPERRVSQASRSCRPPRKRSRR